MAERTIRSLSADEFGKFIDISTDAYPGMRVGGEDARARLSDRMAAVEARGDVSHFGAFEGSLLVGVMRLHDFRMQLRTVRVPVGGLGGVAVDLRHKREHVALDMVRHFLGYFRERGAPLAALYPFRHDFYRQMGFGYGAPMVAHSVLPSALPASGDKSRVDYVGPDDVGGLSDAYVRELERSNGLFERPAEFWAQVVGDSNLRVAATRVADGIGGYMLWQFDPGPEDNFLLHDLVVRELVYDSSEDLMALLAFLRSQVDQVDRIVFVTGDEGFHFVFSDPRNGTRRLLPKVIYHETGAQGLGIMYRVLGLRGLFETLSEHRFGDETVQLRIRLDDDLVEENAVPITLGFDCGKLASIGDGEARAEVTLSMDVSDFSSLIVGAVGLRPLTRMGLAHVSDAAWVPRLDRMFAAPSPRCWTPF